MPLLNEKRKEKGKLIVQEVSAIAPREDHNEFEISFRPKDLSGNLF